MLSLFASPTWFWVIDMTSAEKFSYFGTNGDRTRRHPSLPVVQSKDADVSKNFLGLASFLASLSDSPKSG